MPYDMAHICYENADKNLETNDKQCWGIYLVSTSFTVVSLLFEAFRYDEFSFLKLHEFSVFEEFLLCLFWVKIFQKLLSGSPSGHGGNNQFLSEVVTPRKHDSSKIAQ